MDSSSSIPAQLSEIVPLEHYDYHIGNVITNHSDDTECLRNLEILIKQICADVITPAMLIQGIHREPANLKCNIYSCKSDSTEGPRLGLEIAIPFEQRYHGLCDSIRKVAQGALARVQELRQEQGLKPLLPNDITLRQACQHPVVGDSREQLQSNHLLLCLEYSHLLDAKAPFQYDIIDKRANVVRRRFDCVEKNTGQCIISDKTVQLGRRPHQGEATSLLVPLRE